MEDLRQLLIIAIIVNILSTLCVALLIRRGCRYCQLNTPSLHETDSATTSEDTEGEDSQSSEESSEEISEELDSEEEDQALISQVRAARAVQLAKQATQKSKLNLHEDYKTTVAPSFGVDSFEELMPATTNGRTELAEEGLEMEAMASMFMKLADGLERSANVEGMPVEQRELVSTMLGGMRNFITKVADDDEAVVSMIDSLPMPLVTDDDGQVRLVVNEDIVNGLNSMLQEHSPQALSFLTNTDLDAIRNALQRLDERQLEEQRLLPEPEVVHEACD